jgi:hypothetical protein
MSDILLEGLKLEDLPTLVGMDLVDIPMLVPMALLIKLNKGLTVAVLKRSEAEQEVITLNEKLAASNQRNDDLTDKLNTSNTRAQDLAMKLAAAEQREKNLQDQVKQLQNPTTPVPPPPPAPNTRKDVWPEEPGFNVSEIIGATIENSMVDPSSTQYTAVKRGADALQGLGVTTVRFYLGPAEVFGHIDPEGHMFGKFGNLVDYVRSKQMHFIADGFDKVMGLLSTRDDKLKLHVDGLKQLRTWAICWNDADKENPEKLKVDVKRVRAAGWDGPIIFSLRGNAKLEDYKIEGVYLEIQTFGSEDEFDNYAESKADLLCLDLRSQQTKNQIERIFDVALKSEVGRPRGYFLYTSKTRDWAATPDDEVAEIRDFTKRAKVIDIAQRQP